MLRVALRLISAILTWSRTWRGPGTVTRLMMTMRRDAAPPPPMPPPMPPPPMPPPPMPPPPMPPPPMPPPPMPPPCTAAHAAAAHAAAHPAAHRRRRHGTIGLFMSVSVTSWRMSAIVFESGDLPVQDDLVPDLADLDLGTRERLADPRLEVLGVDRDPDQESRPAGWSDPRSSSWSCRTSCP